MPGDSAGWRTPRQVSTERSRRRQIGDAGITASGLRRRVQSGVLEKIGSHTFRSPFAASTHSAISPRSCSTADRTRSCPVRRLRRCTASTGSASASVPRHDHQRPQRQRAHHHIHTTTELPLIDRATVSRSRHDVRDADVDRRRPVRLAGARSPRPSTRRCVTVSRPKNSCTAGSSRCGREGATASRS